MLTISRQQALKRWDTIPEALHVALFSDANTDFIRKTCEAEHVPAEKISDIAGIAGYVLLGFLHPEDLAEELKEATGINPQVCTSVASAINSRIFTPLKSELDKIYEPLSTLGNDGSAGPKIIEEIQAMTGTAPRITISAAPTAPTKPSLSDAGWSKTTVEQPVVRLSQTPPAPPVAKPTIPTSAPVPTMPPKKSVGEFERLAMQSSALKPQAAAPAASAAPAALAIPTPKPAEPAPVIIHEDAVFRPQQKAPDFHFALPTEKIDMQKPAGPPALGAAVLEFGKTPAASAPKPSASTPRVVHYTEYQPTPKGIGTPPTSPQGPRQITEVTAPPPPPPKK